MGGNLAVQALGAGLARCRFGLPPATGNCEFRVQNRFGVLLFPLPLPWWLRKNRFIGNAERLPPGAGKCEFMVQDRFGVLLFPLPWRLRRNGFSGNRLRTPAAQAALSEAGSAESGAGAFR